MDETTIKEEFDELLKLNKLNLSGDMYDMAYNMYKCGWKDHERWYKNKYCDDGK